MIVRCLLICLALASCAPSLANAPDVPAPQLAEPMAITTPDGATLYVTRGKMRVPAVRADTQRDHAPITLAFIRVSMAPEPSETASVLLAGGPGESGTALVEQLVRKGGSQILGLFGGDLIGIDQRGTGHSSPNLGIERPYGIPLAAEGSMHAWLPIIGEVSGSIAGDLRAKGIYPQAYTTRESADDVDAVRRALGYDKLNLWGRSYGSHLALEVLRRHPEKVGRVVLVGPEGPDDTWKRPALVDTVLERIAQRAEDPELLPRMRRVLASLDAQPVTVQSRHPETGEPIVVTIGGFDLRWITAQALSDPRTIATLPSAYRQMDAGDFSSIAQLALVYRMRLGPQNAMKHFMDLSSGASAGRTRQIEEEAQSAVLGDAMNFPGRYLASAWGVEPTDAAGPAPVASDVPVLILVGDLDARTPVENAEALLRHLPNGKLIVVGHGAHQFDLFGSPKLREVLSAFMQGEPIPAERVDARPIPFRE
ncbi:alpha/beta fold hydrolase [Alteriqipengyuania sp.]|uniref:alpha/beta fold hydrolase n=1 Tax=Alteriqipengyuania sp. TaxID=2800692 RepID=UPI003518D285